MLNIRNIPVTIRRNENLIIAVGISLYFINVGEGYLRPLIGILQGVYRTD